MPSYVRSLLRPGLELLGHSLTATLGTALTESLIHANAVANVVHHVETLGDAIVHEIIVSAIIAFVLGAVVQRIRRSNLARWMMLVGIVAFAATLLLRPVSVLGQSGPFDLSPALGPTDWLKITLWWVSVRSVAYSLGAMCCMTIAATKTAHAQPLAVTEQAGE